MAQNPFDPGYYKDDELKDFGFASLGKNVVVAKNCTIIGLGNISLGDNVRIDGYTTLAAANGQIEIGNNIHIGGYCFLAGGGGIKLADFSGLSQGVKIYSVSDDYSGDFMTNPTVPHQFLNVKKAEVRVGRHAIIGSGSVVLPGCEIGEGAALGAMSLLLGNADAWSIYLGTPARFLKARSRKLLDLEQDYLKTLSE